MGYLETAEKAYKDELAQTERLVDREHVQFQIRRLSVLWADLAMLSNHPQNQDHQNPALQKAHEEAIRKLEEPEKRRTAGAAMLQIFERTRRIAGLGC